MKKIILPALIVSTIVAIIYWPNPPTAVQWDELKIFSDERIITKKNETSYLIYKDNGKLEVKPATQADLTPPAIAAKKQEPLYLQDKEYEITEENGKYGLKRTNDPDGVNWWPDEAGKWIVTPDFDQITLFPSANIPRARPKGCFYITKKDGKFGLLKTGGSKWSDVSDSDKKSFFKYPYCFVLAEPKYDGITIKADDSNIFYCFKNNNKWDCHYREEREFHKMIDLKLDAPVIISESKTHCYAKWNGRWGIISLYGDIIAQPTWDYIEKDPIFRIANHPFSFTGHGHKVKIGNLWGIIGANGRTIIAAEWDAIMTDHFSPHSSTDIHYYNSHAIVKKENQFGLVNADGTLVIPAEWDEIKLTGGNYAAVRKGDKWGLIPVTTAQKSGA